MQELRNWKTYTWTHHSLERIAEYGFKLSKVFEYFNTAIVKEKTDRDLVREFVRHKGLEGMKSVYLVNNGIQFIVCGQTVVTVIQTGKSLADYQKET